METLIYRPEVASGEKVRAFFADVLVTLDAHPRPLAARVSLPEGPHIVLDLVDGNPVFSGVASDFRRRWLAEHPVPFVLRAGRTTRFVFYPIDANRLRVRAA